MTAGTTRLDQATRIDRVIALAGPPPVDTLGAPAGAGIFVYGADWCGDTRRSRALLDRLAVPYAAVDVDSHSAASVWAAAQNGGLRRIPVVVLPHAAGGAPATVLVEPSDDDLLAALRRTGYLGAAKARPNQAGRAGDDGAEATP
jgi:glutaredoxin